MLTMSTASGIGLGVGTALVKKGGWIVHLFDRNEKAGTEASSSLGSAANFHNVNVTDWQELSSTFHKVFTTQGRIDFVFGNAGIFETTDFYQKHPADQIPPEPNMNTIEVNLRAVYTTSYLALHYFRQSPPGDKSLVLTSSCSGLYPGERISMYTACKHGVIGLMRSIAKGLIKEGVRCNAICPGPVRTGIMDEATWDAFFTPDMFSPVSFVADLVLQLVDGSALTDALNKHVEAGSVHGQALEISVDKFYLREQPPYCDKNMAKMLRFPDVDESKLLKQIDSTR